MLQSNGKKRSGFSREHVKKLKIREMICKGFVPEDVSKEEIIQALKDTVLPNVVELFGFLSAKHIKRSGEIFDHGLVSCRLVTVAFTYYIVDSLQDSTANPMDAFEYHASGTGVTAEANTQTALVTEVESRVAGTQIEGATANIYKSVATVTYTAGRTIAEHGIFSASSAGTMMDRSLLGATIGVVNLDQIEWTYELTVNAET